MLYETLLQPQILFYISLLGFACGFLFDVKNFLMIFLRKKFFGHILDFVFTLLCAFLLMLLILDIWFGQVRLWHILAYASSLAIQRFTLGKLLAKKLEVCYNSLSKKSKSKKN